MLIEYSSVFSPQNTLEIKDVGNCAIEGVNDDGLYFYMVILSIRGVSTIATSGPSIPDLTELPPGYTSEIHTMKYDPKKLKGAIFSWLNTKKPGKSKPITSAKIICIEEALAQFRNIGQYFYDDLDLSAKLWEISEEKDNE